MFQFTNESDLNYASDRQVVLMFSEYLEDLYRPIQLTARWGWWKNQKYENELGQFQSTECKYSDSQHFLSLEWIPKMSTIGCTLSSIVSGSTRYFTRIYFDETENPAPKGEDELLTVCSGGYIPQRVFRMLADFTYPGHESEQSLRSRFLKLLLTEPSSKSKSEYNRFNIWLRFPEVAEWSQQTEKKMNQWQTSALSFTAEQIRKFLHLYYSTPSVSIDVGDKSWATKDFYFSELVSQVANECRFINSIYCNGSFLPPHLDEFKTDNNNMNKVMNHNLGPVISPLAAAEGGLHLGYLYKSTWFHLFQTINLGSVRCEMKGSKVYHTHHKEVTNEEAVILALAFQKCGVKDINVKIINDYTNFS